MATPRRFGQEIDQNVRRGPNLSITQRNQIIGMLNSGATVKEVAKAYGRNDRSIRKLRLKYYQTGTVEDKPRSGRPPILSLHQKKIIYRKVRAAPKIEYSELSQAAVLVNPDGTTSKPPSRSTLYRLIKRRGVTNFRCKKRPKLNRGHATKRLQFCREYRHFQWSHRTVKFSDECSVQKESSSNQEWCFRFPWEKWKPEMITPINTGGKPQQMVWGCIWLDEQGHPRRSRLVIMERDLDAPRGGYSAQSYIQALTKGLLPHWRRSQLFMQDGAGIHRSRVVAAFLQRHHVSTIKWPPYSPDLNPIEHLWHHLKRRMFKDFKQYDTHSKAQADWDGFCKALKTCWRRIPGALIKRLILSMPRRIAACRKAGGWQTKY